MQLPREIIVGSGTLDLIGKLCRRLGYSDSALVVTGPHTIEIAGRRIIDLLEDDGLRVDHLIIPSKTPTPEDVIRAERKIRELRPQVVIGVGGGAKIDIAKLSSARQEVPFISVPTTASHDGMASPFASVKDGGRPYSMVTKPPACVISDIEIIASAPPRFIRSGCGDLLAKLTAVRDWEIARDDVGEYFGNYAANLARLSATIVMNEAKRIGSLEEEGVRDLVEALISAGIASGIAGSSRPCSGSEHLFSHALDVIAPGKGLHGEKCGIGAVMMAKLQGGDWEAIRKALEEVGAPTRAFDLGLSEDEVVKALLLAPRIRDRYTILNRVKLGAEEAYRLARETGVI